MTFLSGGRRILHISNYLPPSSGGIERVAEELASRQERRGWRTAIAGAIADEVPDARVDRVVIPAWNGLEDRGIPLPLPTRGALSTLRTAVPTADLVHLHGLLLPHAAMAARVARACGVPTVVTEHVGVVAGTGRTVHTVQRALWRTMARRTVRAVRHAVVLNERVQQEVQEILPDGVGVSTIDNGVDLDRFRPAAGDERAALRAQLGFTRPVVLSVARHVAKKQLPLLLEAARGDVPYDLVLCGKGTAVLHDPANHVWGLGPVTADRVADLYRCADVLVLVSHSEGFPLVVQEAAASGLPMVLTDLPMYRHRFGEGGACLVGPTPEAIRGALRYLIDDPAARASMGAAARAVAQRRWSWEHTLDQYDQLYDDVISAGRRPRVPL